MCREGEKKEMQYAISSNKQDGVRSHHIINIVASELQLNDNSLITHHTCSTSRAVLSLRQVLLHIHHYSKQFSP